ncbi:outer membrane lipoprotein carrier protein LolA [Gangjinia marincola]
MKKVLIVMTLCLGFSFIGNAQNAKTLLDEVSQKVKSYENITIDFKYILENNAENIKQESNGKVCLEGEKYRLELMGVTQLFDGKKIYSIMPEDEEINISSYSEANETSITPSKMLTFYEDGYSYTMDKSENIKGRMIQFIKLVPIDSNAEVDYVMLGIDKQTKHIYTLTQAQEDGTNVIIKVNSFKTDQPMPNQMFTFEEAKYPDYYINRLD